MKAKFESISAESCGIVHLTVYFDREDLGELCPMNGDSEFEINIVNKNDEHLH